MTIRHDDVRNVGFFLFVGGWIVLLFANGGRVTGSLMIILGAGGRGADAARSIGAQPDHLTR